MRAALGRIVDVDIAEESTNLAKYSILNQAAASMLAQANASSDVPCCFFGNSRGI